MIEGRVSYKTIIDKLYRDLGVNEELPEYDIITWIDEALLFIGAFSQFQSKPYLLNIVNHKAHLPTGFYKLQLIAHNNTPLYWSGNSLINNWCCEDAKIPVCQDCTDNTFYIDNYCLYTSVKEGDVAITYLSIPVDEDGYPTIPDDIYFYEACKAYVVKQLDWREWRKGRVADKVKEDSQNRWDFYVQAARGAANLPNLSQLESLKNRLIRLIPQNRAYNQFFRGGQEQKFIK